LAAVKNTKKQKTPGDIKEWLLKQEAYTLRRPVRKRFPRNPYTVKTVLDLWEIHLVDLSSLKKFKDNYRYLLQVNDVFSKHLHSVPLRSLTGPAVASPLESILQDSKYSKPLRRRPVFWYRYGKRVFE
jgi:hypothetical protein